MPRNRFRRKVLQLPVVAQKYSLTNYDAGIFVLAIAFSNHGHLIS